MRRRVWLLLLLLLPVLDSLTPLRWNLHLWRRLRGAGRAAPDVTRDAEFRRLVSHLPAHGDVGLVQMAVLNAQESARVLYFLQYSLAPRRILPSVTPEFVIVAGRLAPASHPLPPDSFALVAAIDDELRVYRRIAR